MRYFRTTVICISKTDPGLVLDGADAHFLVALPVIPSEITSISCICQIGLLWWQLTANLIDCKNTEIFSNYRRQRIVLLKQV